jgi:hypothetical protein
MVLRIPLDRLPEGPAARHTALRNYFCDKDAHAERRDDCWELELAWPDAAERHVDPALDAGLKLWDSIARSEMATARRRSGRVLRALYDTWTLHSWSEWHAKSPLREGDMLTILHIDDHRDLMPPRLFRRGDRWVDPIAGRDFEFDKPESVRSAVESGAVGMGSFLTPVLHRFPEADVRQLTQAPKVRSTTDRLIELTVCYDNLLEPGAERPAVSIETAVEGVGPGRYRITDDPERWVENTRPGPILLHVDMDYFNNRYDGDGDWQGRPDVLDPPRSLVLSQIDRITETLRVAGLVERIADAVIAYSPGFFPAELWEEADRRLEGGLEELYV